jgi:hypothetical protein
MLPLVYQVNDISHRLTALENERLREVSNVLNSADKVCDYPECMCGLYGLPCKKKR